MVAREELPNTIQFWERQGFREILRRARRTSSCAGRCARSSSTSPTPRRCAQLGSRPGRASSAAGDLIVLSGELGAGKTTFTQGLGTGLRVRGAVTSPTFVIARVHPSLDGGPDLVHVDAYRLGGIDELDDLDLDTSLDDAVTVVEWGEGVAEGLAESRLEIRIIRALAHEDEHDDLDPRRVLMTPIGPRWHDLQVPPDPAAPAGREGRRDPAARLPPLRRGRARPARPDHPAAALADDRPPRGPCAPGAQRAQRRVGAAGWRDRGGRDPAADGRAQAGRGDAGAPRGGRVRRDRDRADRACARHRVRRPLPDHPRRRPVRRPRGRAARSPGGIRPPSLTGLSPIDAHLARLSVQDH